MLIERVILREVAGRLVWLGGLLLALFSVQRLGLYLTQAAEGGIPPALVFSVWLLKMPYRLPELLAFAVFMALLLTYARMLHDRELTILQGNGFGILQHLRLVLPLMAIAATVSGLSSFMLAPHSNLRAEQLLASAPELQNLPLPGRFHTTPQGTLFVEQATASQAPGAYLYLEDTVITARAVELLEGDVRLLELRDGWRYDGTPPQRISSFQYYRMPLYRGAGVLSQRPRTLSTGQLLERGHARDWAELQFRIDQVILCLLLPLLAVLLHPVLPGRQLRYTSVALGIGGYFVYRNLLEVGRSMLVQGQTPMLSGTWWIHLLLLCVLLALYYRHVRPRGPAT